MYLREIPQTGNDIETNEKGHMIIDLLSSPEDAMEVEDDESCSSDADTNYMTCSYHGEKAIENAEATTGFDAKQLLEWFEMANRTLDEKPKVKRKF